jgi:SAM-dependent methyltransferase
MSRAITKAPTADWISEHRRRWAVKPSLRMVYGRWFTLLRAACASRTPVVELGCGPGFFKEVFPEVVATDAILHPYAERVVDAGALPYGDYEVGNLVLLDVFHHLPQPAAFLREAARTLKPGGRLIMLEPWISWFGRVFFRFMHEECDLDVSPEAPWQSAAKHPMEGNVALAYIFFRAGGFLEQMGLPLRVIRREPFAALPWIMSGGFQPVSLLPPVLVTPVEWFDRGVSLLPAITALRCLLVIEKVDVIATEATVSP